MKKNLLTFGLILTFSFSAYLSQAQIGKGTHLLGGSVYFTSQSEETTSRETRGHFFVSPSWGQAIRQNLVVGGDLTYRHENSSFSGLKGNSFGAGVFTRKYHNFGTSGFFFFAQARLGAQFSNETGRIHPDNSNLDATRKGINIDLGLQPGIAYAITPRLHLETGLNDLFYVGYGHSETKSEGTTVRKSNAFNGGISLTSNFQWNIGFRFLLAGR